MPEITLNLAFKITERTRVFVGYDFLFLSDVARPGDLIDRNINTTRTPVGTALGAAGVDPTPPGAAGPNFAFRNTNFWAQGIQFGLEFRW